jgi:NAD(P)-dependent dehydrogenase (short-subunit alcohol dehydrogenase family)
MEAAVHAAETELGPITILINNSGIAVAKRFLDTSEAEWDQVLDTNLKGAFLMARAVAKHLAALGKPGAIVNIASIVGLRSMGQLSSYAASKGGLIHLTCNCARVGALGIASTRWRLAISKPTSIAISSRARSAGRSPRIPAGRFGQRRSRRRAAAARSDFGRYINGAVIRSMAATVARCDRPCRGGIRPPGQTQSSEPGDPRSTS